MSREEPSFSPENAALVSQVHGENILLSALQGRFIRVRGKA